MPRRAVIAALLLAAVVGASPAASAQAAHRPYGAHVSRCHRSLAAAARSLAVTARVHAPRQSSAVERVGVRLHLLVRHRGDHGFSAYRSPDPSVTLAELGLDTWVKSASGSPGPLALRYTHVINNLDAPATYRFRVGFRWYGSKGHVLRTHSRLTGACVEPDMRPNLVVHRVAVLPVSGRNDVYKVVVRNRGRTAAGAFDVTLAVGDKLVTRSVGGLAPRHQVKVGFGPQRACGLTPSRPVITLDADGAVDESNEADDVVPVTCP